MKAQLRVVAALFVLHNILITLRELDLDCDADEDIEAEDGDNLDQEQRTGVGYHISRRETERARQKRDDIAEAMWSDYIAGRRQ
jgi:hypothetical protein